jgi:hypothetical protein
MRSKSSSADRDLHVGAGAGRELQIALEDLRAGVDIQSSACEPRTRGDRSARSRGADLQGRSGIRSLAIRAP